MNDVKIEKKNVYFIFQRDTISKSWNNHAWSYEMTNAVNIAGAEITCNENVEMGIQINDGPIHPINSMEGCFEFLKVQMVKLQIGAEPFHIATKDIPA